MLIFVVSFFFATLFKKLSFPYPVKEENGKAKFVAKTNTLVLTLPVVPRVNVVDEQPSVMPGVQDLSLAEESKETNAEDIIAEPMSQSESKL
jgi:hypothetical protein